jgi:Flp pilus assembly pilin Flp
MSTRLRRLYSSEEGQTFNEYLMIAGLMTAMAIIVFGVMYATGQNILQKIANCVLNETC